MGRCRRGVEELLVHLGVDKDEVIAFGDAENDIEMLQLVGTGYSVANALPRVKEVADAATLSNDEDGVAEILKRVAPPERIDVLADDGLGAEAALEMAAKGALGGDLGKLVVEEASQQSELKEALDLLELQKTLAEELGMSKDELLEVMEEIEQQEGGLEAFLEAIEAGDGGDDDEDEAEDGGV